MKATKKIKATVKAIFEVILFIFGNGGEIRKNAVDNGICDFSGQGRNEYGN